MNFEDVFNRSRSVKAPDLEVKSQSSNQNDKTMESIISQLKKVDQKTKLSIRLIQLLYVFMMAIVTYYIIDLDQLMTKVGLGAIFIAFSLVILVQQLRYIAYQNNYDDGPVIKSLYDAKSRMQVFTKRTWLVIPIWILIDFGVSLIIWEEFPNRRYADDLIIIMQLILIALIALDFYVAYIAWKRDQKPVLDEIDKMIDEIESD